MTQGEKRALEIKKAISALLRRAVPNRAAREALAKYIGVSYSSVEGMMYRYEGGADSWINAVLYVFDLEAKDVHAGISELRTIMTERSPVKDSDKIWFREIDAIFNEEEKIYWLSMMKYAAKLKQMKREASTG